MVNLFRQRISARGIRAKLIENFNDNSGVITAGLLTRLGLILANPSTIANCLYPLALVSVLLIMDIRLSEDIWIQIEQLVLITIDTYWNSGSRRGADTQ